ncbi:MAG: hypothetical protein E6Q36_08175 [Chryseobacterium sp.]|nr:MAG: hypothetical protein E6Q36_08175 [Chryseobacterium sp.]
MKKLIYSIIIAFTLMGCFTAKRIDRKIVKFNDKNPSAVVKTTLRLYPVRFDTLIRRDTIFPPGVNIDSIIDANQKYLPGDTTFLPDSTCVIKADSLVKYIRKQNSLIEKLKNQPPIIVKETIRVLDSAKIKEAQDKVDSVNVGNKNLNKQIDTKEKKRARNERFMWIFLVLFLGSVILNIVQFKKII